VGVYDDEQRAPGPVETVDEYRLEFALLRVVQELPSFGPLV
jgi:hypothetical protein